MALLASALGSLPTFIVSAVAAVAAIIAAIFAGRLNRSTERQKWQRENRAPLYAEFLSIARHVLDHAEELAQILPSPLEEWRNVEPDHSEIIREVLDEYEEAYSLLSLSRDKLDLLASDKVRNAAGIVRRAAFPLSGTTLRHPSSLGNPNVVVERVADLQHAIDEYIVIARADISSGRRKRLL